MTTRVVAILNPARSRADRAVQLVHAACADRGWPAPTLLTTTVAEPGGAQARRAVAEGADLVVVGGGDGTVRAVAEVLGGTGLPLGILPLGTANLFARNLDLPRRDLTGAVRVALDGRLRGVDLGWACYTQQGPVGPVVSDETAFLVVLGIGHDADTVSAVDPGLKRRIRWAAYFLPGLRRLAAAPVDLAVRRDGGPEQQVRAWSLLVANCGRIPLGITVVPGARPDDGRLELALVAPPRVWHWVPIAVQGLVGHRRPVCGLGYRQVGAVRVTAPGGVTIQVDGDPHPEVLAVSARVEPGALMVRVP
ncbi:diacylglycerol/lipid kinase family protein [Ornithinicoccus hortensis]|uniref:Diacylglycerol kinase family enzyme n=1 Tax=Ornithinicoccus hortensis TaxID=82346 RepID=A0A542YTN9_9MICO|nr:diacylglycerol kinase family protein [Ornithinicoccus hortensis]TQL51448.1 diacylglycerol kinase family enzyme [Ornithinicoccus hortensis]